MRISDFFLHAVGKRFARNVYPLSVGLAVFFAYPSLIAFQDVAAMSPAPVDQRWLAHIPEAPGQMVLATASGPSHLARPVDGAGANVDGTVTGSLAVARRPALEVSTTVKRDRVPQKINRSGKGDRVVSSSVSRPPAYFSAGSVLQRHSMLEPKAADKKFELAFVAPRPADEAFEIASVLHRPASERPSVKPDLPVVVASLVVESADNVLAYGEEEKTVRSPFAAVLAEEQPISLIPKLGKGDHYWADDPLPLAAFSEREQNCLTAGIYFEARGEPVRGQAGVAQVILNRVRNPAYPDSICGVVYQNKDWRNRCQFSFACDGIRERVNDPKRWRLAQYVARETTEGRIWLKDVGSSTHYHATYVRPKWARAMKKVGKIGLHVFYRTFGGGWS